MGPFSRIGALKKFMFAIIALLAAAVSFGIAQTTKPAPAPAPSLTALTGKWEDIDQRFVFLTVELSSTEASLNAVNRAILVTGHQQSSKQQQSQNYQKGSEQMDRKGGGPIPWQDLYGKTAESFYYHPGSSLTVESKSSSVTIVGQSQRQTNIQANTQGDQTQVERPPQFDYIYRANADAQKRADAEVAKLGGQVDQLQARRKQLEAEQSTLWCKIALRALTTRELSDKPIYRFEPIASGSDDTQKQELDAVNGGAKFMRKMNALVAQAQKAIDGDQAAVYSKLADEVASARSDLKTTLLMQPDLQTALDDDKSNIGQFAKAAKRLEDSAQNLSDAYGLAQDGDNAGDIQRKLSFRGAIQQMTMDFAATVLTADQCLQAAATEWKIKPDVKKPVAEETTMWIVPTTRSVVQVVTSVVSESPQTNTAGSGPEPVANAPANDTSPKPKNPTGTNTPQNNTDASATPTAGAAKGSNGSSAMVKIKYDKGETRLDSVKVGSDYMVDRDLPFQTFPDELNGLMFARRSWNLNSAATIDIPAGTTVYLLLGTAGQAAKVRDAATATGWTKIGDAHFGGPHPDTVGVYKEIFNKPAHVIIPGGGLFGVGIAAKNLVLTTDN